MKPQSAAYLASAAEALADAKQILAIHIPRQAARLAYYAQFHGAQALIFERTGKIAKTHKGVQTLFHRLIKQEAAIDSGLAGDLSASYHFKEAADYETGAAGAISSGDAAEAIRTANRFLAIIKGILEAVPDGPAPVTAGEP
jgi:uncharacterized protein (UPF0332 family)